MLMLSPCVFHFCMPDCGNTAKEMHTSCSVNLLIGHCPSCEGCTGVAQSANLLVNSQNRPCDHKIKLYDHAMYCLWHGCLKSRFYDYTVLFGVVRMDPQNKQVINSNGNAGCSTCYLFVLRGLFHEGLRDTTKWGNRDFWQPRCRQWNGIHGLHLRGTTLQCSIGNNAASLSQHHLQEDHSMLHFTVIHLEKTTKF